MKVDASQHQCAKNAPKEHFMLVLPLNTKEREEHEEHEQIVHRQGFLYQVACQKFQCHLMRVARIEEVYACTEQQRYTNPDGCHPKCLVRVHLMLALAAEHLQVGNQHDQYQRIKTIQAQRGIPFIFIFKLFRYTLEYKSLLNPIAQDASKIADESDP